MGVKYIYAIDTAYWNFFCHGKRMETPLNRSSSLVGLHFTCGLEKVTWARIVLAQNGLTLKAMLAKNFFWKAAPEITYRSVLWQEQLQLNVVRSLHPTGQFCRFLKNSFAWMVNGKEEKCGFKFFLSDVHYSVLPTRKMWSTDPANMKHYRNKEELDYVNWLLYSSV